MPATSNVGVPRSNMGSGFQYTARLATKGQPNPMTRDTVEQTPRAWRGTSYLVITDLPAYSDTPRDMGKVSL